MTMSNVSVAPTSRSSSANTSALTNLHSSRNAVRLRSFFRQRQRGLRRIDRRRLRARPPSPRAMRKAAGVAVAVEHTAPVRQLRHEGAVVALVEIPAGLLPASGIGKIGHAVLFDGEARRHLTVRRAHV